MKSIHVHFTGRYGLSNRVRSMAGHYALALTRGFEFTYQWDTDPSCPGKFDDVFMSNIKLQSNDVFSRTKILITGISAPSHCGSPPSLIERAYDLNEDESSIFHKYVRMFYDELKPKTSIKNFVELSFKGKEPHILGVHIRRTDMIDHCIKRGLDLPSDTELYKQVDFYLKSNPSTQIFLSSDNPTSEGDFKKRYPEHVFTLDKSWMSEKSKEASDTYIQARLSSLEESVADLYALSKCKYIIGTKHSSFSSFGATWGAKKHIGV